ncbi:hypothetical protein PF001_g14227 [Phytophthora fragariae]|uniref:Uncharacterized protein n=1 Tax=Phytophthora fragariae TaxID=53985 RepID=A0A6A4DGD5_9STRA|nr:hypothetical protein PF003_g27565 [Phytophthora fragariae]KAE8928075.1 hypothetical protein PF009_g21771 [Phytophthora fragariae]KAE9114035.1 hypothetical protein PF006_g19603 [Phytophthora fragariae]KAE9293059.1 hypothetical protein PF008_g24902 [Phytophthora fragariae]KAE9301935.1 hypothetical protein PF001_g14227 [Phytophthora fragariae]
MMTCCSRSAAGLASRQDLLWAAALARVTAAAVLGVIGLPDCMTCCCSVNHSGPRPRLHVHSDGRVIRESMQSSVGR